MLEKVGPLSETMREWVASALKPLLPLPKDSIMYFPDEAWVAEHVDFLSQLTVEVLFDLLRALHGDLFSFGHETDQDASRSGFKIQIRSCSHLGFVFALTAVAEKFLKRSANDLRAILEITPTGEKDKKSFILSDGNQFQLSSDTYPYQWHPLRVWLQQKISAEILKGPSKALKLNPEWLQLQLRQRALGLQQANSKSPVRLGNSHFSDGKKVFHGSLAEVEAAIELKECNIVQFEEIFDLEQLGHFARDDRSLWYWGQKLKCHSPQNFRNLPELFGFYTDGEFVFSEDQIIPGVLSKEIKPVDQGQFLFRNQVFFRDQGRLGTGVVDAATYRVLNHRFSLDQKHVYLLEDGQLKILEGLSSQTTKILEFDECTFLFDDQKVAVFTSPFDPNFKFLKSIRAQNLRALKNYPFVTDEQKLIFDGRILKGLNYSKFETPKIHADYGKRYANENDRYTYFIHDQNVYHIDGSNLKILNELTSESFEILAADFARDEQSVIFKGSRVVGSDPLHFSWIDRVEGRWSDGTHSYLEDRRLPDLRSGFDFQKLNFSFNLERVGDHYFFDGFQIEGWNRKTHRISSLECIEDKEYFYRAGMTEGPHIIVWPKSYSEQACGYYVLDLNQQKWVLKAGLDKTQNLTSPILSVDEFEKLIAQNETDSMSFVEIKLDNPIAELSFFPTAQILRIQLPIQLEVRLEDGKVIERYRPVKTAADRKRARQIFEALLKSNGTF